MRKEVRREGRGTGIEPLLQVAGSDGIESNAGTLSFAAVAPEMRKESSGPMPESEAKEGRRNLLFCCPLCLFPLSPRPHSFCPLTLSTLCLSISCNTQLGGELNLSVFCFALRWSDLASTKLPSAGRSSNQHVESRRWPFSLSFATKLRRGVAWVEQRPLARNDLAFLFPTDRLTDRPVSQSDKCARKHPVGQYSIQSIQGKAVR